jgi:hypothetical protein
MIVFSELKGLERRHRGILYPGKEINGRIGQNEVFIKNNCPRGLSKCEGPY